MSTKTKAVLLPVGQVEILDQHSVKVKERLKADEVVPNLDKVPRAERLCSCCGEKKTH